MADSDPEREDQRRRRVPLWLILVLAGLVVAVVAAGSVYALRNGDSDEDLQTVTYEAPSDPGENPFADADVQGSDVVRFTPAVNTDGDPLVPNGEFGGSGSNHVCDREKLLDSLLADPGRMRAWANVLGIDPDEDAVSRYIRSLKPVTLAVDTRVTNHSYVNGKAVPFQSILAAGSAVLADKYGRPVVRCKCGNPLREPVYYPKAKCKKCPPKYTPPKPCYWPPYPPWDPYPPEWLPPKWRDPYPEDYPKPRWGTDKKGRPCWIPYPDPPDVKYPPRWYPPKKETPGPTYPTYSPRPTYSAPPKNDPYPEPHDDGGYTPPPYDEDTDHYSPPDPYEDPDEH
jgi:hypothetical protein